jgi:hypothetical protein
MQALRPDLSNYAYPIHHLVNPEMFGEKKRVKCLYIPPHSDPCIITDNPETIVKNVFKNSKTEDLPINKYVHSIVDSNAIAKNLPINVLATHFFRNLIHIYSMCAIVYRRNPCFWVA